MRRVAAAASADVPFPLLNMRFCINRKSALSLFVTLWKKNLGFHDKKKFPFYFRRRRILHCLLSDKERLIRSFKRKNVCDKSHIVAYLSKFTQVFVQKTV